MIIFLFRFKNLFLKNLGIHCYWIWIFVCRARTDSTSENSGIHFPRGRYFRFFLENSQPLNCPDAASTHVRKTQSFRVVYNALQFALIPLMHTCRAALTSYNQSSTGWVQFNGLFRALGTLLVSLSHLGSYPRPLLPTIHFVSPSSPLSPLSFFLPVSISWGFHNNASSIGGIVRRMRNLRPGSGFLE